MDKYVTSLALSKKLKQNGYPQTTINHWERPVEDGELCPELEYFISDGDCEEHDHKPFAAPIAQELLEQLPFYIKTGDARGTFQLVIEKLSNEFYVCYAKPERGTFHEIDNRGLICHEYNDSLADALAVIWLWLRNNGYPLPCGINQSRTS